MNLIFLLLTVPVFAKELLLVQTVCRHGDRTPQGTYADDVYQEDYWKLKWGELTDEGKRQEFMQGQKLKALYVDDLEFLSATYKVEDVYVRSTDVSRTLTSAYANIAGFYAETKGTLPNWTLVPVHTVESTRDYLLHWDPKCDRRDQLYKEQRDFTGFIKFMKQHEALINEIADKTKLEVKDLFILEEFFDTIYVEKLYNLTIPEWITSEMYKTLQDVLDEAVDYYYGNAAFGKHENVELIRLTGGVLLEEMIENMRKTIKKESVIRYYAYSAHDSTLNALLRALGAKKEVVKGRVPDYASTLSMELWKLEGAEHAIRLQYSENASSPFRVITSDISGCPKHEEFCALGQFVQRSEKYVAVDTEKECKRKNKNSS